MHITITGNLGSGKSTICKLLNEKYQFETYSTGKVQRELARDMNLTTLELNQLMCSDKKYDNMIDDAVAKISRENKEKDIIFDSRLAWHFVEHSFKVFVMVSLQIAAERVMNDQRGEEEKYSSIEEAMNLLAERAATENRRYKDIYNLSYMDFNNYNLIIDSTYCKPDMIAEIILREAKEYEKNYNGTETYKMLISPKRLIRTSDISEAEEMELKRKADNYQKECDRIEKIAKVKIDGDEYIVIEGMDEVKAAYLAQEPYIEIKTV